MNFTEAQSYAIGLHGCTMLVSAAAGSGKTATLTERIIREITDKEKPADIAKMLIVTFTRAAAGELRTRIGAAISSSLAADPGNEWLASQLVAVGGAKICTIDSFYLDIVKENFQLLGLPSSFRLADDSELDTMRISCMEAVIDRYYAQSKEFAYLADCLTTIRGEGKLSDILLKICSKFDCRPEGVEIPRIEAEKTENEIGKTFLQTRAGACALDDIGDLLERALKFNEYAVSEVTDDPDYPEGYKRAFSYDYDFVEALVEALRNKNEQAFCELLKNYSPLRLPPIKKDRKPPLAEQLSAERNELKKKISAIYGKYFTLNEEELATVQRKTAGLLRTLSEVLCTFRDSFLEEKGKKGICEFSDIRSFAYSLLIDKKGEPTHLAADWRDRFSEIFVDEYQDIDPVQDAIFRAISRHGGLFMVGDIKQSIYSFRGAEPSIFSDYRQSFWHYTAGDDCESEDVTIFMSENFRCSKNIVDFTNAVSSYLFSESEGGSGEHGIGYFPQDDLVFSRTPSPSDDIPVEITLIEPSASDTGELETDDSVSASADAEIEYVCNKIKSLIAEGTSAGDIAVLSRSKKTAAKVVSRLTALGLSAANSVGEDIFASPEVLMMVSLLSAIDNPQRDIPLAAILKSPVFGFTLADLVRIRSGKNSESLYDSLQDYAEDGMETSVAERCKKVIFRLDGWRRYSEAMPVDKLIRRIWRETSALTYAGGDIGDAVRTPAEKRANLQRLYEFARRFEASSFHGLSDFVKYINGMIEEGIKIESDASSARNAVSVMTIHKSKGLEFPVVFLVGMGSLFNRRELNESCVYCPGVGMAISLSGENDMGISKLDTPMRRALSSRLLSLTAEEEIRILYVALTRARDKLFITAKTGRSGSDRLIDEASVRAERGGREAILSCNSRISWILTALASGNGGGTYEINTVSSDSTSKNDDILMEHIFPTDVELNKNDGKEAEKAECFKTISERFDFKYKYAHLASLPAKLSVSKLYPGVIDDEDTMSESEIMLHINNSARSARVPSFMIGDAESSSDSAAKGTATHLFLQFCDFSKLDGSYDSIDEEALRLMSLGFITRDTVELLRRDELVAFCKSKLFSDITNAQKVYREQRFNIFLPAAQFSTDPELSDKLKSEKIFVQGVIDIFFTDKSGDLILCDYKTDRLTSFEMKNKSLAAKKLISTHSEQLGYYRDAIELICEKKPDKVLVYSLCLGDTVEVPFE